MLRGDLFTQAEIDDLVRAGLMVEIESGIFTWTESGRAFVAGLLRLFNLKAQFESEEPLQ